MNSLYNEPLAEQSRFIIPDYSSSSFTNEDLMDDIDGLQLRLQRVKIPAGGVLQFEMPGEDLENPEYVPVLEGVILFNHPANSYWPEGNEYDDNTPPLCQAVTGKMGYGDPGGICETCAYNRFGSGLNGGKACKNMRMLYLLRSGDFMPIQLTLPPTSLTSYRDFANWAFLLQKRPVYSGVVQIALRRETGNGFTYSVATFKKLYNFEGEELAQISSIAKTFREQMKLLLNDRASYNRAAAEELAAEIVKPKALPDNNAHFEVGSLVDGEREPLPA